ncbi:hypothetical protein EJ04DRAFT_511755 [Polyplosphaeria fusca]|uniref:Uncharacterized protein n=1 Tax=Polyplosphaeria fusca TaxID=682080 RepID=A0A9P4QX23_9PLEO|nr:hypothetical protein EJ04DRAFT_511755 [Polyplosphaeria fusca]
MPKDISNPNPDTKPPNDTPYTRSHIRRKKYKHFESSAKSSLRSFCTTASNTLPRELLDAIILQLISLPERTLIDAAPPHKSSSRVRSLPWTSHVLPRYLVHSEWVGYPFARDVAQLCYHATQFVVRDVARVDRFFRTDAFELDLEPLRLVRSVLVVVSKEREIGDLDGWEDSLRVLEGLRCKDALRVHVVWDAADVGWVLRVLDRIAAWVFQMRWKGVEVGVETKVNGGLWEVGKVMGRDMDEFAVWRESWGEICEVNGWGEVKPIMVPIERRLFSRTIGG